jgi:hypothetical protein
MQRQIIIKPDENYEVAFLQQAVAYAHSYIKHNLSERNEGSEQGYVTAQVSQTDGTCVFKLYHTTTAVIVIMEYKPVTLPSGDDMGLEEEPYLQHELDDEAIS